MGSMGMEVRGVVILPDKIPATDFIDIAVPIIIDPGSSVELRAVSLHIPLCSIIKTRVIVGNPCIDYGDNYIR